MNVGLRYALALGQEIAMPKFDKPVISSSNGFAAAELHDRDALGAYVLIRFPDPKAPKTSRAEDRDEVIAAAKKYLQSVVNALS